MTEETLPEKLLSMNLELIGTYTKYKEKHKLRCIACGTIAESTIQSRVQTYKKNGTNGCLVCKQSIYSNAKKSFLEKIDQKGYDVLTEHYDGNQGSGVISVRRRECNHVFEITPTNLMHRDVICPLCSRKEK